MIVNGAYKYKQKKRHSSYCSESFQNNSISVSSLIEGTFIWSWKIALRD